MDEHEQLVSGRAFCLTLLLGKQFRFLFLLNAQIFKILFLFFLS
jgi:hypothetical protein